MRLVTLGVGAMASPRFRPAGLLVSYGGVRVAIDGGPGAVPPGHLDAWLVTDEYAELRGSVRKLAAPFDVLPRAESFLRAGLVAECLPVVHTNHPTYGFRISAEGRVAVWAPEFLRFPRWAEGADLMFAEAAAWDRPIHFRGRDGGHLDALSVAREARERGVRRLVFAHIGRPTIRALERGERPPFGEVAYDGEIRWLRRRISE